MLRAHALDSPHIHQHGFGLIELLICLGLMAGLTSLASPFWGKLQARVLVDTAREQLLSDLQSARLMAMQQGQTLQVSRLSGCSWANSAGSDWSCGWQLRIKASGQVLRTSAQHRSLLITYSKTDPIDITPQGDLGQIGDRWSIKALPANLNLSEVVCLNSASRMRWQMGESCS